jgi:aminopeptidase N
MTGLLLVVLLGQPHPRLDDSSLARPLAPAYALSGDENYPPNPVDILHYDIQIEVLRDIQQIVGTTGITLTSAGSTVSSIRLDLRQLTVGSVWDASGDLPYYQNADSLFIDLSAPLAVGDTTEIFIQYSGTPYHETWGGFWFHVYITYQIGVGIYTPGQSMGKCMFPCWDHQNDKAAFDFHITCPEDLYAVANGDSTGVEFAGGKATYSWSFDQQMPTYLATIAVGDYVVLHDSTDSRIHYYVYSWDIEDALGSFVNVNYMLANLESLFGPYPWDCKFGLVETPKGDMEHTSAIAHVASAVNGYTNYDWLIAHEMTHMWWGACVTMNDWQHIWLKEGFATLGEALWMETYGDWAYRDYMVNDIMLPYLNSGEMFPLDNPTTPAEIFGYTTYQKGASVLHMLRYVLGDEKFFEVLNYYFVHYQYGLVEPVNFRDDIETVTGQDIDWFFDTWVYGWGYPLYSFDTSWQQAGSNWEVSITVDQMQTVGPFFEMPLEFRINGDAQDEVVTMWNDIQGQNQVYSVGFEPRSVEFDPFRHILCGNLTCIGDRPVPPAGGLGTMHFSSNPCAGSTSIMWPGTELMNLEVTIYDLTGRVVRSAVLTPDDRLLQVDGLPAASYLVEARAERNLRQTVQMVVLD